MVELKNSYTKLPERFFERVKPAKFIAPKLIHFNYELASSLGLKVDTCSDTELAQIFSGQISLTGSEPIAQVYAAHQFGHFVPQLGDGRAHLLGEVKGQDIQLKGSGQTRFSRRGDGRSALGPVLREYIISEYMSAVGIPTTRALCCVTTGENVFRQYGEEPGAVFTRVAPSHIRVGTFQYFAAKDDWDGVEKLLEYAIGRHYPQLNKENDLSERALRFLVEVGEAQAQLIAKWMSIGFIHGVMNTDNYSIGGFTIDFGPCAFLDEYKERKVFSSIDQRGRYSYGNQVAIGQWNLLRLADCLLPLINSDQKTAIKQVERTLSAVLDQFEIMRWEQMIKKLGIHHPQNSDIQLVKKFLSYLEKHALDFTQAFRKLPQLLNKTTDFYPSDDWLEDFQQEWRKRDIDEKNLNALNPFLIPRNHQVEKVIRSANQGDFKPFKQFLKVLENPFGEEFQGYGQPPRGEERVKETFCGT